MKLIKIILCFFLLSTDVEASLTIQEQIGQLIICHVDGEVTSEESFQFLQEHCPGGIILFNWSNGLTSPKQVRALSRGLQSQAKELGLAPLFIAIDQEGGLVARLRKGFTEYPGNASLGRANSEALAYLSAKQMASEMIDVGVNFAFAPVVDVNSNPKNPVIGIRSYGDDADLVTSLGLAATRGFADMGVISCLKHFPGHGDVETDSHLSLPILRKSKSAIYDVDLVPFQSILNHSPAVMTGHLKVLEIDDERCATLSPKVIEGLLRKDLGFQGLVVSDSLTMGGVLEECKDIGEAAQRAIEAGCDLLVIGGTTDNPSNVSDVALVRGALMEAVDQGRISRERLQASLDRIARVKKAYGVGQEKRVLLSRDEAEKTAYRIAKQSVRLEKGSYSLLRPEKNLAIVAPEVLREVMEESGLADVGENACVLYYSLPKPTEEEITKAKEVLKQVHSLVFVSYNAWRFPCQASFLVDLSKKYPLTLIASRDSQDARLGKQAHTIITTVSPTAVAFRVIRDQIADNKETMR